MGGGAAGRFRRVLPDGWPAEHRQRPGHLGRAASKRCTAPSREARSGQGSAPLQAASLREMQVTQRVVAATSGGSPAARTGGHRLRVRTLRGPSSPGGGASTTPAGTPASAPTCGGTRPPVWASWPWPTAPTPPCRRSPTAALGDLVIHLGAPLHPTSRRPVDARRRRRRRWLTGWGGQILTVTAAAAVRALCADNVEVDVPWPERVAVWHALPPLPRAPDSRSWLSDTSLTRCGQLEDERVGHRRDRSG